MANSTYSFTALQYYSTVNAVDRFGILTDSQAVTEGITDLVISQGRPRWRDSELFAAATRFPQALGYEANASYMLDTNNVLIKVAYGTKGSVRPDFYSAAKGHCVDVKNYTITTASGRNNLVNNVVKQYQKRVEIFPEDTVFEVLIDVRGQNWTQDILDEIASRISNLTSNKMIVSFIK